MNLYQKMFAQAGLPTTFNRIAYEKQAKLDALIEAAKKLQEAKTQIDSPEQPAA